MRRVTFVLILTGMLSLTSAHVLRADDTVPENTAKTRIETFLNQKGRVLIKDIYILGKVTGLYSSSGVISAVITYEPGEKESRVKGLIIEVIEGQRNVRSHSSYLDVEEIEGLSAALAAMGDLTQEGDSTENYYSEAIYTTIDELSFGIYLGETGEGGFISAKSAGDLTVSLEPKQMSEIKKIVDYGYTLLKIK
jgi:hypothetical protein